MPHMGNVLGNEYVIVLDLLDSDDLADCEVTWDKSVRNGTRTINEVRAIRGQQPVEDGDTPLIMTATGGMTLDQIINPPDPIPPPAPIIHTGLPPSTPGAPGPEPPGKTSDIKKELLIEDARRALKELRKSL